MLSLLRRAFNWLAVDLNCVSAELRSNYLEESEFAHFVSGGTTDDYGDDDAASADGRSFRAAVEARGPRNLVPGDVAVGAEPGPGLLGEECQAVS